MPTINIPIEKLKQHPKNVRKNLGDLQELTESIRQKGVFQNLTVVSDPESDAYLVVIGNRRLAAAQQAGLKSLPCVIAELSEKDQISTMLLENMQRSDLTIYEQAQGFQQCLDLGMKESDLCNKTGLSRKTVTHRLELAHLGSEVLKKKTEKGEFSLNALYELEKVKDLKERKKLFEKSQNNSDLLFNVRQYISTKNRTENTEILKYALSKSGIKKGAKERRYWMDTPLLNCTYRNDDKRYDVDKMIAKFTELAADDVYWRDDYGAVDIRREAYREEEVNKKNEEREEERQNREAKRKKINDLKKAMDERRAPFIQLIIEGKIPLPKDEKEREDLSGKLLMAILSSWFTPEPEELAAVKNLPLLSKLVVLTDRLIDSENLIGWNLHISENVQSVYLVLSEALKVLGYEINEEEKKLLSGEHEVFEGVGEE